MIVSGSVYGFRGTESLQPVVSERERPSSLFLVTTTPTRFSQVHKTPPRRDMEDTTEDEATGQWWMFMVCVMSFGALKGTD